MLHFSNKKTYDPNFQACVIPVKENYTVIGLSSLRIVGSKKKSLNSSMQTHKQYTQDLNIEQLNRSTQIKIWNLTK